MFILFGYYFIDLKEYDKEVILKLKIILNVHFVFHVSNNINNNSIKLCMNITKCQ